MLVTLAGHDIFKGRALVQDSTPIRLCPLHRRLPDPRHRLRPRHREGGRRRRFRHRRVRGKIALPRGSSDAALAPYHVERSKLFVRDRLSTIDELDGSRVAAVIEHTRFPYSSKPEDPNVSEEAGLLRAADLIGQLGDPHYLKKANALYCEFEEVGLNRQLGYDSPADLIDKYPNFYWRKVSPYIQDAIRYLSLTSSGRQWINSLYANVFRAEHELRQHGPQL